MKDSLRTPSGAGTRFYHFNSANFFLTFAASL